MKGRVFRIKLAQLLIPPGSQHKPSLISPRLKMVSQYHHSVVAVIKELNT